MREVTGAECRSRDIIKKVDFTFMRATLLFGLCDWPQVSFDLSQYVNNSCA